MPLVNYRGSEEAVLRWKRSDRVVPGLHEIHEVTGRRQSAKQVLLLFKEPTKRGLGLHRNRDLLLAKLSSTIFRRPSADPAVSPNPVRFGEATRTTGDRPRASTATS